LTVLVTFETKNDLKPVMSLTVRWTIILETLMAMYFYHEIFKVYN